jgi:thiamine biosynthesis lipoprotein
MGLDFGYFGKEFAVDHLARMADQHGISDALIDLGRVLFALGGNGMHPFWHIGIEDGIRPGHCRGGLAISDMAVSTAGDFARYFTHDGVHYSHIIDPRTGWPVTNGMRATTVIAPSCLIAGMLSTAAHILGPQGGHQLAALSRDVEICTQSVTSLECSPNFDRFFFQAACEIPTKTPYASGPNRLMRELAWLTR